MEVASLVVGERRISDGMLPDRCDMPDSEPEMFDFTFFLRPSEAFALPVEVSDDDEAFFCASYASPL